nr:hypothetical protein [Tanacetum cinerariifolium]
MRRGKFKRLSQQLHRGGGVGGDGGGDSGGGSSGGKWHRCVSFLIKERVDSFFFFLFDQLGFSRRKTEVKVRENICNNDKILSEIQLEHEKEDELVVVVVKVVYVLDCKMVVKEIEDRLLEEIEKFEWWFEQDIGGESEADKEKREIDVQVWTFMRRVLMDSRDEIERGGDVLRRRRRVGMK